MISVANHASNCLMSFDALHVFIVWICYSTSHYQLLVLMTVGSYQVGSCQQQAASAILAENIITLMELKSCLDEHKKVSCKIFIYFYDVTTLGIKTCICISNFVDFR